MPSKHKYTVQGTLGGIVIHCSTCKQTCCCDYESEIADMKLWHETGVKSGR